MLRLTIAFVSALALSACGGLSGEPDIVATVARPTAAKAQIARDWVPDIDNGARIFAERCTDCHGVTGDGQGELVLSGSIGRPLDMTERSNVSAKSPLEWYEVITDGRIDKLMPPWENALTEAERWDVALYSYGLSYDDALLSEGETLWRELCSECEKPAVIPPVFSDVEFAAQVNAERFGGALAADEIGAVVAYLRATWLEAGEPNAAAGASAPVPHGSISGRVVNGSGGVVPPDTVVQLQVGNAELGFNRAETTINADMTFSFTDVPLSDDLRYVVSVTYEGRLFSRQLSVESASDLTLEIFDLTQDPAVLSVSRIELFIDAVELADLGRGLYVSQLIGFHNISERIFSSGRGFDDGREAVLLIQFPRGARVMSGADNGRYVIIEDMEDLPDSVIDTRPVPPGDGHQVILEYFLPYAGETTFEQPFNYLIDAEVKATVGRKLTVESDQLRMREQGAADEQLRLYTGRLRVEREPQLRLSIFGDPFATSSDEPTVVTRDGLLALLAGGGVVSAALAAIGLAKRRREGLGGETDQLVAELARLDDDHDQGRINHDLYHHQRRELKARLAQLMASDD